jgi:Tfp pilus assembly protein FimT
MRYKLRIVPSPTIPCIQMGHTDVYFVQNRVGTRALRIFAAPRGTRVLLSRNASYPTIRTEVWAVTDSKTLLAVILRNRDHIARPEAISRKADLTVKRCLATGFSLIEVLVVVTLGMVLTGIAVPLTLNSLKTVRLTAAVSTASGAIQSTRYLAIMHAYPYQMTFTPSTNSYQVLSEVPPAATFSNFGTAIPISGPGAVTISRAITLQFYANGIVTEIPTTGNMTFSITNAIGGSKTLTVSGVGNVAVTSP